MDVDLDYQYELSEEEVEERDEEGGEDEEDEEGEDGEGEEKEEDEKEQTTVSPRAKRKKGENGRDSLAYVSRMEDERQLQQNLHVLKAWRGRQNLSEHTAAIVLHVYTQLKLQHQLSVKKSGRRKKINFVKETARLTGCGVKTVSNLYRKWHFRAQKDQDSQTAVVTAGSRGNFCRKATRIPSTAYVGALVRQFIRDRRINQERVTATQVLGMLRENRIVNIKESPLGGDDENDYESALRVMRSYLTREGFVRGVRQAVGFPPQNKDVIARYIGALFQNRSRPPHDRLREVCFDRYAFSFMKVRIIVALYNLQVVFDAQYLSYLPCQV